MLRNVHRQGSRSVSSGPGSNTYLKSQPSAVDQKTVPAACPMGWSAGDYRGHSRS